MGMEKQGALIPTWEITGIGRVLSCGSEDSRGDGAGEWAGKSPLMLSQGLKQNGSVC